jgi:FkbM family methyltransferase
VIPPHETRLRLIRALARLPEPIKQTLRHSFMAARVTSDRRSLRTYIRLTRIARDEDPGGRAVGLRLRPLGGRRVLVRPSTSDVDTVWGTFARGNHRPPPELAGRPLRLILDLGANIGLTMADLAVRFPQARLVGIELDADNVFLARANIAPWGDRCELVHGAVWTADTEAFYEPLRGHTAGHRVGGVGPAAPAGAVRVPAFSLNTLLDRYAPGDRVDYLKMDTEGAECALLRENAEWAHRVACMNVEVHHPYRTDECERDLRALGFETRTEPRSWGCVIGVRNGARRSGRRGGAARGAPGRELEEERREQRWKSGGWRPRRYIRPLQLFD